MGSGWKIKPTNKVNVYAGSLAYIHLLGATNFRLLANVLSRFDEDPLARYPLACGRLCSFFYPPSQLLRAKNLSKLLTQWLHEELLRRCAVTLTRALTLRPHWINAGASLICHSYRFLLLMTCFHLHHIDKRRERVFL